jgi:hypothetical protein
MIDMDKIMAREAIEAIGKAGEESAERMIKQHGNILELMESTIRNYESLSKSADKDRITKMIIAKGMYHGFVREAVKRGLDVSSFPDELNYKEMQN